MLEMPSDLDRPWEPWAPRIGDRVRVRLNGECREVFKSRNKRTGDVIHDLPHAQEHNGLTGTVIERPSHLPARKNGAHCFFVLLDDPPTSSPWGGTTTMAPFAAIELELLEDDRA